MIDWAGVGHNCLLVNPEMEGIFQHYPVCAVLIELVGFASLEILILHDWKSVIEIC